MIIRDAELRDARGIAEVHVRSWQAAYAGIVPDEDLAQLSVDEREQFWAQILSKGVCATFVLVNRDLVVGWWVPRETKTAIQSWLPSCTAFITSGVLEHELWQTALQSHRTSDSPKLDRELSSLGVRVKARYRKLLNGETALVMR
jgi:hypothetical protein